MSADTSGEAGPRFDRSFLPDATFEFVVIGDTHYMLDPKAFAAEFDSVRHWPRRAEWALRLAAALKGAFVVHLGDLAQEYVEKEGFSGAREKALDQIRRCGMKPHHVAGNQDVGDKPDPTMPAEWVTFDTLGEYHRVFGRSWYSFDNNGVHGIVLNSQIMNGPLPEAEEQKQWLESDLSEHAGQRIFVFIHMPPFFVDEDEPGLSFYNSIDEPARGWLLGLLRKYRVELLFSGHTHFAAFNRVDETRLFVVPSTTTSRAGFYEAFSVCPPTEQGRNDVAKMGFYLVRVREDGARVHFIRTNGETGPTQPDRTGSRLITRISPDLPESPVGLFLRLPLAQIALGSVAWPGAIRQRVRDDHPFRACLELGARHVRIPAPDLDDPLQSRRLSMLRDEGVCITAFWIQSDRLGLYDTVSKVADRIDAVEVQMPGTPFPDEAVRRDLERLQESAALPVTLSPLFPKERMPGKFHPRMRIGYHPSELPEVNKQLSRTDTRVDRLLCRLGPERRPWEAIQEFMSLLPLSQIEGLDFLLELPGTDEAPQVIRATEGLFASCLLPGCRLFLDPLVDLDRTNDINHGLLDRLSNPRPAFHAVRCLNTILFSHPESFRLFGAKEMDGGRAIGISGSGKSLWLLLPEGKLSVRSQELEGLDPSKTDVHAFHLVQGFSRRHPAGDSDLAPSISGIVDPVLLMSTA